MIREMLLELWELFILFWGWVFPNRRRFREIRDQLDNIERRQYAILEILLERRVDPYQVIQLAAVLRESNDKLAAALQSQGVETPPQRRSSSMNPLQPIIDEVTRARGAQASATALINGFQAKLNAAVAAALAGGASAQQIADLVTNELAALASSTTELGVAIDANDD